MKQSERSLQDWRDLLFLVVVWGSSFALTKIAVESLSPSWVVAYRGYTGCSASFYTDKL
jgi:drug/metabolite transporter (DMT)-like permease